MEKILTSDERSFLISLHRKEKQRKRCDRIKAVLLYDAGYSYSEISRILLLDDETIRRHVGDYIAKKKLKGSSGGSSSYLSEAASAQLCAHLDEKTYLYVKDICAWVKERYGVSYSISGMTRWLKAHGYRYKKPHAVPGKMCREAQESFKLAYEELKETVGDSERIYFVDSVHPQHQTKIAYGWIKQGTRKAIATTGKQKRLNFMGGLCLEGHKIVMQSAEKVDAVSIGRFLKKLRRKSKTQARLHVIWDNAGYHRSKAVQACAEEQNIKLHYLPPYSPNLNPIERLWKIMHEQVTYNRYYEQFTEFIQAMNHFFKTIGRKKKLLRARINDNFQCVSEPNFAF